MSNGAAILSAHYRFWQWHTATVRLFSTVMRCPLSVPAYVHVRVTKAEKRQQNVCRNWNMRLWWWFFCFGLSLLFFIHYFLMEIEICPILRHPQCVPNTQFGVPGHVWESFHRWFGCQAIFYVRIKFSDGSDGGDDGDGTKWLTMTILIFGVLALTIFISFACAHVWRSVRADFFLHLHQDWICEPKHKWMLLIIISAVWCIHDRFVFHIFFSFNSCWVSILGFDMHTHEVRLF